MALGDLVKRIFVGIKVDGAEEAKAQIKEVGAAADGIAKKYELGLGVDDAQAKIALRALELRLRALRLSGDSRSGGGGGLLGGLFGGLAGGGATGLGSGLPVVGGLFGAVGPVGAIATIVVAASALANIVQALVSAFAAATAGVAAFGALAYPLFSRILTAAGLTGDRFKDLPVGIRHAAEGVQNLVGQFDQMAQKLRPDIFKIFNTGLQIASKLLPYLLPLAKSAATAIEGLLKQFDKYLSSPGFKQFMAQIERLSGPAIASIGKGLGNVALAISHLLTSLSPHTVQHIINSFFDTIAGVINGIAWLLKRLPGWWDAASRAIGPILKYLGRQAVEWWQVTSRSALDVWKVLKQVGSGVVQIAQGFRTEFDTIIRVIEDWYNAVVRYSTDVIRWYKGVLISIKNTFSELPAALEMIGKNAIQGLLNGLKSIPVIGTVLGIAGNIVGTLKAALHIRSPSQVMYDIGVNIAEGLIDGLASRDMKADQAARRIARIITARIQAAQQYAAQVQASAVQFAGIAGAATGPAFSGYVPAHYNAQGNLVPASGTRPASAGTILGNLGADLGRIRRFADAIRRLSNRGLDSALIAQIVAAGPGPGLDIADALLRAPGAIARADRLENRINRQSARLGAYAAASQYGGGNYVININGGLSTAHQIALEVEKIIKQLERHRGGRKVFG